VQIATEHLSLIDPIRVLGSRLSTLSIPTIRCDAGGGEIPFDDRFDAAGLPLINRWTRSGYCVKLLQGAIDAWGDHDDPQPTQLYPGCWAIPVPLSHRRRRIGYLVGFAFEPRAIGDESFLAGCQSARVDALLTAEQFETIAVHDARSIQRISRLIAWANADLLAMRGAEDALGSFSAQLTEAYEEIALLYKLGHAMNAITHPQKFVGMMIGELQETLSFRWSAVGFVEKGLDAVALAGRVFTGGETGESLDETRERFTRLLAVIPTDCPTIIKPGGRWSELFDTVESVLLVHPFLVNGKHAGAIVAADKFGHDTEISSADMKLLEAAGEHLSILLENAGLYENQHAMFIGTLRALVESIDAKDPYTSGHSERVAHLARQLASAAGHDDEVAERVWICGLVHDVGKIGVPEAVLCKPGRLTDGEFDLIRAHPEIGYRILKDIPQMSDVLPGVLSHHERWDGRGYPNGIAGEDLPLFGRLIGLADSFDAMSSTRTYRSAMPREKVLAEIINCAGTQFDPELAPIFAALDLTEYDEMVKRHAAAEALSHEPNHDPATGPARDRKHKAA
jgi:HD-GYP domain-containing protein (c-di-GMP phosphodiesterase class II)